MSLKWITVSSVLMTFLSVICLWQIEKELRVEANLEAKMNELSRAIVEQKMQRQIAEARLVDFKQVVATHFHNSGSLNFNMRTLASVIPHRHQSADKVAQALSRRKMNVAKEKFDQKKYDQAIDDYLKIMSEYPDSIAYLESAHYLVKSFYHTSNKQEAIKWAEKMMKLYPDSLWTAKTLFVLADIFVEQERDNDALEVYDVLSNSFDDEDIKKQVRARLSVGER